MKRRIAGIAALAATAAVVLGLPTVATTAAPDVRGPKCADIFIASPSYTGALGATATVSGTLTTPTAPSCQGAVYTVNVVDGGTQTQTFIGDGSTDSWSFSFTVSSAPEFICLYGTSQVSSKGSNFADTAPDTACTDTSQYLELNGPPGASGMT
jgi:hypothetical protein